MPLTVVPLLDVCLGHVVHVVFVWALLAMYVPAAHGIQPGDELLSIIRDPALQFFKLHLLLTVLPEFHVAVFHALAYVICDEQFALQLV